MSSSVDQIKSKMDIVSLVGSYVKLEKAGGNWKGRCPFHNEKTPSFFVSPDRGSYYCFGCHVKGDIFTFVQEFEGLDFIGALKVLADKTGVNLEQYDRGDKTEKERLFSVLEQAVFFYEKKLSENKKALEYLKDRGVKDETIKNFRVGYAPAEWRDLFEYLSSRGVTENDMLAVGLIKHSENAREKYYDTFRGRIMFPINDSSGRVVGFSGRALIPDEKNPKYLNSPETELFNKSEILFGLDKAKTNIRLKDYSILVEGQMDLVMLHQIGMTNTVASSGTALTEKHINNLKRRSNNIIMFFDDDKAGFSAANRTTQIALILNDIEVKLAKLPPGKDPADIAKEDPILLKEIIDKSKNIIKFNTDTAVERVSSPRELGKEIERTVLPYIRFFNSSIEVSNLLQYVSLKTKIRESDLRDQLNKSSDQETKELPKQMNSSPPVKRTDAIERRVIGFIMWHKQSAERNKMEDLGVDIKEIENKAKTILGQRMEEVEKELEKEKDLLLFETESYYNNKDNLTRDIDELLVGLEEEYLKKEFGEAMNKLQKAEQTKDSSEILKYLEECQRISQRINTIKMIKNAYEKK